MVFLKPNSPSDNFGVEYIWTGGWDSDGQYVKINVVFTDSPSLPRSSDATLGSQPHFDSLSLGQQQGSIMWCWLYHHPGYYCCC